MRRLIPVLTAAALALAGCHREPKVETIEESSAPSTAPKVASIIHTGEPAAAVQLLNGFYGVEGNSWRWTAGRFTVVLKTPDEAKSGASLTFRFAIPDPIFAKSNSKVQLSATANGEPLGAETYTKSGDQVYSKEVPAKALTGPVVTLQFALNPIIPAGTLEARELGVVASSFALEPK